MEHHLSRLPDNTALRQQELLADWLHFSAKEVLFIFFATGVFCLCMGIILLLSAKSTREMEINYTKICANCAKVQENVFNFDKECTCSNPFSLTKKMKGNVYMYYKLHGFCQNLYRYIYSRSNRQLVGKDVKAVEGCAPFKMSHNETPIVPCGAIDNSIFNDTIILSYNVNSSLQIKVPMLKTGLTWWTDEYVKFQNPNTDNLFFSFYFIILWGYKYSYELDKKGSKKQCFLNDDFIAWIWTAAIPTFKKPYQHLNRTRHFTEGLPAGNYSFSITYNFLVTRFHRKKSVILCLSYTVTGAMTWLATFSMLAVHMGLKNKKSLHPFHQHWLKIPLLSQLWFGK
uniref:Cell cycle control protein n=1 Tax=Microcebus murinus TaxID=30608 RepID=A0A8C5YEK1_MICMU